MKRAEFSLQEQFGGRGEPFVVFHILGPEERWHDAVRGDGHSYRPGGPETIYQNVGESDDVFYRRASERAQNWELEKFFGPQD